MYLNSRYEVILDTLSNSIKLKDRSQNKVLPYVFNYIDMRSCQRTNSKVIRVKINNQNKLFDLEACKPLKYNIADWGKDGTDRFITMRLENNNLALYDTTANKFYILPNEVTETFINYYCKNSYCLVKVFGGGYTYCHIKKNFVLNKRYSLEQIRKNSYEINWKEVVVNSPEDFTHLPQKYFEDKRLIKNLLNQIVQNLKAKKDKMSKEEYQEMYSKIKTICENRVKSEYSTTNQEK